MKHVLVLLFSAMSSAALAQTTATVDPGHDPAPAPLLNEAARPDNCSPTGVTASGDYVFPLECRGFIERERARAAEHKPVTVEEKSAAAQEKAVEVEEKPTARAEKHAAKQPEAGQAARRTDHVAPTIGKPAKKLLEAVSLPKRPEHEPLQRAASASANDCTHYRSYNRATGSYRSFDGKVWACRQAQVKR